VILSINIPDAIDTELVKEFCATHGYMAKLEDGSDNPDTPKQFMKKKVIEYLKEPLRAIRIGRAMAQVRAAASTTVDSEINIT